MSTLPTLSALLSIVVTLASPAFAQGVPGPPSAPTGLVAVPNPGDAIVLDWNANPEPDVIGYAIYRAETSGGPYEPIADFESPGLFDEFVERFVRYYYVVTAYDKDGEESELSEEASAILTTSIERAVERPSGEFAHRLLFESDGVLPDEEGASDGWTIEGFRAEPGVPPPSLSVAGGLLSFETTLAARAVLVNRDAWTREVDPNTSWTFDTRVRVLASDGSAPGLELSLSGGASRLVLRVEEGRIANAAGETLAEGDHTTTPVTVRVAFDAPSSRYHVFRNGEPIAEGIEGEAATDDAAISLIDAGSATQVTGEADHIAWDATGAYLPAPELPVAPRFFRGDADASGTLNLTDGVFVFSWLFLGGGTPTCLETADTNNDGLINLSDGVLVLNHLFLSGPAPAAPGPPTSGVCGVDPDPAGGPRDLGCALYEACP